MFKAGDVLASEGFDYHLKVIACADKVCIFSVQYFDGSEHGFFVNRRYTANPYSMANDDGWYVHESGDFNDGELEW